MPIPINSIVIPDRFVSVASRWYSGMYDMLYAVCSTGALTIGTIRPSGCDTDEQWYYTLWLELSADIMRARIEAAYACDNYDPDYSYGDFDLSDLQSDYADLVEFEDWVDEQVDRLCMAYGLEDWCRM